MAKALYFNIPATGHINPTLPVITELVNRGEEVVYVNSAEEKSRVESTGARFLAYPDIHAMKQLMEEDAGEGNIPRNMRDLVRISNLLYPFTLEVIEREKPDYVIYDTLASWAKLASQTAKIPSVSFCVTFIVDMKSMPPMPPSLIAKTMGQMIRIFPSYLGDAIGFRREHGKFPVFLMNAVMSLADMNIVFTSKEFQPNGVSFGDNFKFVGLTLSSRHNDVDFPFDKLHDGKKVYISLGTHVRNDEFLRTCFEAFKTSDAQFILSAGKQTDISKLEPIPENFIVRNFVPQLEVLKRVDAFITHGGMNSVQEGLLSGVPLIVVPQQVEQAVVALQVEKHSAGIALQIQPPFGQVSARELRDSVSLVLTLDKYAENAKYLRESLEEAGGVSRAVDEILAFAKSRV